MQKEHILLTYNIRNSTINEVNCSDELNNWKYRKWALIDLLKKQNADVICFQEDSNEQVVDILAELKDHYKVVRFKKELAIDNQEYNSIFIKKEFTILDRKCFYISKTPNIKSKLKQSFFTRHMTSVTYKRNDEIYTLINVHLDNSENKQFKKKEAEVFLKIINANFKEGNILILGDFNFGTDDNEAYKLISHKFIDVSRIFNIREPTHPNWLMWNIYRQIDYCWVLSQSGINFKSFEILKDKYVRKDGKEMEPSDHFLVKCIIN